LKTFDFFVSCLKSKQFWCSKSRCVFS